MNVKLDVVKIVYCEFYIKFLFNNKFVDALQFLQINFFGKIK